METILMASELLKQNKIGAKSMKYFIIILSIWLTTSCQSQEKAKHDFLLSISPIVDKTDETNQLIIPAVADFLKTKNESLTQNRHWLPSDFDKYIYPYLDLINIEDSKLGQGFYQPTLMEIIATENPNQKIVKIAFIGHDSATKENQLKAIYNLVANVNKNAVLFSRYLDYATQHWTTIPSGSLTYKISPMRVGNQQQIIQQQQDIEKIVEFFNCDKIPITYYSCINPKELFEIKGFDYNPMMYIDTSGGLADFGNLVFSGNSSELYTHEIIHIYTSSLFPKIDKFIDEGLATYMAGSGKFSYEWHRNKLGKFLEANPNFNFANHTDAYERFYFENETSIPYLSAALILERTFRLYGKEKVISLMKSDADLWATLKTVGLTKENINSELRKEVQLPIKVIWNF